MIFLPLAGAPLTEKKLNILTDHHGSLYFQFFDKTSYIIGGHMYSLNDIENGVLRANKRGALKFFVPFGKSDPRLKMSQMQVMKYIMYCF